MNFLMKIKGVSMSHTVNTTHVKLKSIYNCRDLAPLSGLAETNFLQGENTNCCQKI